MSMTKTVNELAKDITYMIKEKQVCHVKLSDKQTFELTEEMFESLRKKVVKLGGYLTMIKNSNYLPYVEDVFTINQDRFVISQNIKKSFDPKRILNPGKMYTGI